VAKCNKKNPFTDDIARLHSSISLLASSKKERNRFCAGKNGDSGVAALSGSLRKASDNEGLIRAVKFFFYTHER
jgi:hypothetical protein